MADYLSSYTGAQVDTAVEDKVTAVTQEEFNALVVSEMPLARIYIITTGTYANTLWRSDGTSKIQLSAGGGSGGGTTVIPIVDTSVAATGGRLAALTIAGYTYRVTHIGTITSETMTII